MAQTLARERLVYARLIAAESAASLEDERDELVVFGRTRWRPRLVIEFLVRRWPSLGAESLINLFGRYCMCQPWLTTTD
jgi:hypothetical protein